MLDAAMLADSAPGLRNWFAAHSTQAVVLRPDRYIVGVASNAADLARVCARLPLAA